MLLFTDSFGLGPFTTRHMALNPKQRDELADCDSLHHPTLKESNDFFIWCPPRIIPNDPHEPDTHKGAEPRADARIPEEVFLCDKSSRLNLIMRKDIYEDQPESGSNPSRALARTNKDFLDHIDTVPLKDFPPGLYIQKCGGTGLESCSWTWGTMKGSPCGVFLSCLFPHPRKTSRRNTGNLGDQT